LTSYEDIPSSRDDEKWCRFYFTATPKPKPGQPEERTGTRYRVDVCSNRALKSKTLRLVPSDLEKLLYWCGTRELIRSLGHDPSVTELRAAIRPGSLRDPQVGRVRFPNPDAFEATLAEPREPAALPVGWTWRAG
jgi:hypothetical protein